MSMPRKRAVMGITLHSACGAEVWRIRSVCVDIAVLKMGSTSGALQAAKGRLGSREDATHEQL